MARWRKPRRSYALASKWAQEQGITSQRAWFARIKLADFPDDIPANPGTSKAYAADWQDWGVFLGTGVTHPKNRRYRSYADASAWAQQENITSRSDWDRRTKPDDIPAVPWRFYKAEWKDLLTFLGVSSLNGTSRVELILKHGLRQVLDLDEARMPRIDTDGRVMHVDMIDRLRRIVIEYDGYYWHKAPEKMAMDREKTRRLADAGLTVIRVREAPLAPLDPVQDVRVDAPKNVYGPMIRAVLQHLQVLIMNGVLSDHGLLPKVQAALQSVIDETEFYDIIAKGWVTHAEASAWAQQREIASQRAWRAFVKRGDIPNGIPANPERTYKAEWQGWGDFLGTSSKGHRDTDRQVATYVINLVKITDPENDGAFALQASA